MNNSEDEYYLTVMRPRLNKNLYPCDFCEVFDKCYKNDWPICNMCVLGEKLSEEWENE